MSRRSNAFLAGAQPFIFCRGVLVWLTGLRLLLPVAAWTNCCKPRHRVGNRSTGTPRAPTAAMTPESSCSNARSTSSEGVDSDTPLTADSLPAKRKRPVAEDPNGLPRRRRRHTAGDDGVALFQSHMSDVSGNIDDLWENMTSLATQHTIFRNDTKNFHAMQENQLKVHKKNIEETNKNIEEIWVWVKRRDGVPAKLETLKAQVNEIITTQEQRNGQLQQEIRGMKLTFDEALKKGVAEQVNKFENRIEKLEADHDVRDVATKNHQRRIKKLEEARVEIDDGFKTIKDTLPTLATTNAMTQLVKDAQDATHYECKKRNTGLESSIETKLDNAKTKLDTTNMKLKTTNAKLETQKTSLEDFQNAVSKILILPCVRRDKPVPQARTASLTPASTPTISPPQPRPETQPEPQQLPNGKPSSLSTAITSPMEDLSFSTPWPKLMPIALPLKPTTTPSTATNEDIPPPLPPPTTQKEPSTLYPTSKTPLSPLPLVLSPVSDPLSLPQYAPRAPRKQLAYQEAQRRASQEHGRSFHSSERRAPEEHIHPTDGSDLNRTLVSQADIFAEPRFRDDRMRDPRSDPPVAEHGRGTRWGPRGGR